MNQDTETPETEPTPPNHQPVSRYAVFAGLSLAAAALFGWATLRANDPIDMLFLVASLAGVAWYGSQLITRISVESDALVVREPWRRRRIEFRQLIDVSEAGRALKRIVVAYHPLQADGLVNLDAVRTYTLPAVNFQDELLQLLQHHTPR
jgi:hypothetical protein